MTAIELRWSLLVDKIFLGIDWDLLYQRGQVRMKLGSYNQKNMTSWRGFSSRDGRSRQHLYYVADLYAIRSLSSKHGFAPRP